MKAIKKEIKRVKKQLKIADLLILASEKRYNENLENLYRQRGKLHYHQKPLKENTVEQTTPLAISIVGIAKAFNSALKTLERKLKLSETLIIKQEECIVKAKNQRNELKNKLTELKGCLK